MTTDLAAALNEVKSKPRGIDALMASLPPKEATALEAALRDPDRVSVNAIVSILLQHGHVTSFSGVKAWRLRNLKVAK